MSKWKFNSMIGFFIIAASSAAQAQYKVISSSFSYWNYPSSGYDPHTPVEFYYGSSANSSATASKNNNYAFGVSDSSAAQKRYEFDLTKGYPNRLRTADDFVPEKIAAVVAGFEAHGVVKAIRHDGSEVANPFFETNRNSLNLDIEYNLLRDVFKNLKQNPQYYRSVLWANRVLEQFA